MVSDNCHARLDRSGGYSCPRCGLQWDADDTDPPECRQEPGKASETTRVRELGRVQDILNRANEG